jgi:hypothetical protein
MVQSLPHPAYGLDRLWNACCWNTAAEALFCGWLGEDCQRNLLRYIFLDPAARQLIPDWEHRARRVLAEFRADYSHTLKDGQMKAMVDALRAESRLFARAWDEQGVLDREGGVRSFTHHGQGPLRFRQHTFSPSDRPDFKLVVLMPA